MRSHLNAIVAACLAGAALAAAGPAEARHGWRGGIYVGVGPFYPFYPSYWPGYYGPGYYGGYYGSSYYGWPYYVQPPVVVAAPPTVYVERSDAAVAAPAPVAAAKTPPGGFWYWCADSRGYYPSVATCASAWVPVAPR
jgi:hypothetical protein